MDALVGFREEKDDLKVEFEVLSPIDISKPIDEKQLEIYEELESIQEIIDKNQERIEEINKKIDRLTNHADGIDYMISVASGMLAGVVDSIFVGELSLEKANEVGGDKVNNFVIKIAQRKGYKGDDLLGAVKYLESQFPIAADKATNDFGGGTQHHLRDFSHHPTPMGLIFSLLTQFTRRVYGTDTAGFFISVELRENDLCLIGKNLPEKLLFGIVNWFFHMVSDMAGSSSAIAQGKIGTGLPGPFVSFLKEMSALPIFRNMNNQNYKEFSVWISKLFNGTLLGKRDENGKLLSLKFDLRTEIGIVNQQAMPVILNECIVRGFYFLRRLYMEIRDNKIRNIKDLCSINWKNTLPFKNRTIIRMLTISTGTMTAIDLADAAIRSAIKSGGINPAFLPNMLLRVNFVGMGRFAIAVGTDVKMGMKRSRLRTERIEIYNQQILLTNAKVFYKSADVWISAEDTEETLKKAYDMAEKAGKFFSESLKEMRDNMNAIGRYIPEIKSNNPELLDEINDILEWR